MPQATGDPQFNIAVNKTGAEYREARSTILSWPHARRAAGIQALRASREWESQLTADILEGWIRHAGAFNQCLELLRNDFPGPKPVTGLTAPVRGQAVAALGERIVPRILELLWKTPDEIKSSEAAALFVALAVLKDSRALRPMRRILEEPLDPVWRRGAVLALAALGNDALPDVIRATAAGENDVSVRTAALRSLHQFSDPRAAATLLAALREEWRDVPERRAAATSLYNLSNPDTVRPVSEWLNKETDEEIQLTLVMLIGKVGSEAHIPALERLSRSASDPVRQVVRTAIADIQRREGR
jgi:HEAT repeat protein